MPRPYGRGPLTLASGRGRRRISARFPLTSSSSALTSSTCPQYYLIGSRGSGQKLTGDAYNGLGQEISAFSSALGNAIQSAGQTYGFEANPYPAVGIMPGSTDGFMWARNLLGVAFGSTGAPFGGFHTSVQHAIAFLLSDNTIMQDGGGSSPGAVGEIQAKINQCGNSTKILLAGYSQGAQVTGDVYQQLTAAQKSHIFGVFLLADPRFNGADASGVNQRSFKDGANATWPTGRRSSRNLRRPRQALLTSGLTHLAFVT
jgi:Cutinase